MYQISSCECATCSLTHESLVESDRNRLALADATSRLKKLKCAGCKHTAMLNNVHDCCTEEDCISELMRKKLYYLKMENIEHFW